MKRAIIITALLSLSIFTSCGEPPQKKEIPSETSVTTTTTLPSHVKGVYTTATSEDMLKVQLDNIDYETDVLNIDMSTMPEGYTLTHDGEMLDTYENNKDVISIRDDGTIHRIEHILGVVNTEYTDEFMLDIMNRFIDKFNLNIVADISLKQVCDNGNIEFVYDGINDDGSKFVFSFRKDDRTIAVYRFDKPLFE